MDLAAKAEKGRRRQEDKQCRFFYPWRAFLGGKNVYMSLKCSTHQSLLDFASVTVMQQLCTSTNLNKWLEEHHMLKALF